MHARPQTAADVVLQAGTDPISKNMVIALSKGKNPVDHLQGLSGGKGRGERTEIHGTVPNHFSGNGQARILGPFVQFKEKILFVIPKDNIVPGPVLFDQTGLEKQGLFFGPGLKGVDFLDPAHLSLRLQRQLFRGPEIRSHSFSEIFGLAHINDLPGFILHQIDTRGRGKAVRLETDHTHSLSKFFTNRTGTGTHVFVLYGSHNTVLRTRSKDEKHAPFPIHSRTRDVTKHQTALMDCTFTG
jgi:hypothetical protein